MKTERFPISEGGFVRRNGIDAYLCTESCFYEGEHLVLHFREVDWSNFNEVYPEVSDILSISPLSDFCWPQNGAGECEFENQEDGIVLVKVFMPGVCKTPLLICVLPDPKGTYMSRIYKTFMSST